MNLNIAIAIFILSSAFLQLAVLRKRGVPNERLYVMDSRSWQVAAYFVQVVCILSAIVYFVSSFMGVEPDLRVGDVPPVIWASVLFFAFLWIRCCQLCVQKSPPNLPDRQS